TLYIRPSLSTSLPSECRVLSVSPLLREIILHAVDLGNLERRRPRDARLIGVMFDQLQMLPTSALHLSQPRDARANKIAIQIQRAPGDRRSLQALTKGTGASQRTIERLFLTETGMTFGRFRQQVRLIEALRLLAAGEAVTAVALDVGYDSVSAFVSVFRKI